MLFSPFPLRPPRCLQSAADNGLALLPHHLRGITSREVPFRRPLVGYVSPARSFALNAVLSFGPSCLDGPDLWSPIVDLPTAGEFLPHEDIDPDIL